MNTNLRRGRLRTFLAATSALGALGASAFAQDGIDRIAEGQDAESVDTITVTGSRLNQANLRGPSPITAVDSEELRLRGTTRVEDLVNILPQAFVDQTSQVANGATGTSSLDLRGLGAQRTLVLVDGRRLPFGNTNSDAANLDMIPAQLIQRVEITTGGESAVYGSDAISGVANFILRDDFEGFEVDAQGGFYWDQNNNDFMQGLLRESDNPVPGSVTDGENILVSAMFGANTPDGRGNVTLFGSYLNQGEIVQGDHDVSACALGGRGNVGCVGSFTFRSFYTNVEDVPDVFLTEDGALVELVGGPAQTFNFAPTNFYQRPIERFNIYGRSHYEITENIEAYADLSFMNNNSDGQVAFSGTFARPFTVNCDNPFLGAGAENGGITTYGELLGCDVPDGDGNLPEDVPFFSLVRNVDGDPRNSEYDTTSWRTVGGLRGTFAEDFDWDVFGQFARTKLTEISTGDLNFVRTQDALNVVLDDDGNPVCESGNAGCVPYNLFERTADGQTRITAEAIDYIQGVGIVTGETNQQVLGATIQSDFTNRGVVSPFAGTGVQVLLGTEWRSDELSRQPDDVSQIPGGRGFTGVGGGTLPVAGEVRVFELFGEASIPLIEDAPLVDQLVFDTAYRWSDYTTAGNGTENTFEADTYRFGLRYVPVPELTLRAQYQRAVRAPNVYELFTGQNTGLFDLVSGDPCAGDNPERSLEECARTGVTAAQYGNITDNPAGQFNQVTGGNPELGPETADTYTLGAVWEPSFVDGLRLSVDYFNIELADAIQPIPPATTLERCLDTGDATFCDLIVRDSRGSLWIDNSNFEGIQATNVNIGQFNTSGYDVTIDYDYDIGSYGSLNLNYVATFLDELSFVPVPGLDAKDCVGLYAGQCGVPNFEYKHRALLTYSAPLDLDVSLTWRRVSSVDLDGTPAVPLDATLEGTDYFDLGAGYLVSDRVSVRGGINNIMGRDPELSTAVGTGEGNGNTFPGIYDAVGGYIFLGATVSF